MTLPDDARRAIEERLFDFVEKLASKKKTDYANVQIITPGSNKPFHEALLPKELLRSLNFERSFSTTLGSVFERCAYIVAETRFAVVESQHRLEGYIPADSIAEVSKVIDDLNQKKKFSNYQHEVSRIVNLVKGDASNRVSRNVISDLYVKADDGTETYFEIKTPKPNKGQCLRVTEDHLLIHCIRKVAFPQVRTHFGMAYNPYGEGKENTHSFVKTYLDAKHHALMGKAFWDYLGGPGACEELQKIYRKVGAERAIALFRETLQS